MQRTCNNRLSSVCNTGGLAYFSEKPHEGRRGNGVSERGGVGGLELKEARKPLSPISSVHPGDKRAEV